MSVTTAPQQAQPELAREQIEAALARLQPVDRVMLRMLLLQYLDPTPEDVTFMAWERSEPQMKAGSKFGGLAVTPQGPVSLPKEWTAAVEGKIAEFASRLREHRNRLELQVSFLTDYFEGLRLELEALECLLTNDCGVPTDALADLRAQARQAAISYALRKLGVRAEKEQVEEAEYLRERLSLEYQAHTRRMDRFKKRLEQVGQERQAGITSSLSDQELATIWGINPGPILNRRVKAVQKYLNALGAVLNANVARVEFAAAVNAGLGSRLPGGAKNEGIGTKPISMPEDLWSRTLETLAAEPMPIESKPCQHDGGGKVLTGKLRSLALYTMSEEDERALWPRTIQCFHCLTRLRTLQQEGQVTGQPLETVIARIRTRTAMPRKEPAEAPSETPEKPAEKGLDIEERLRPFIGDDAGQEGAGRW